MSEAIGSTTPESQDNSVLGRVVGGVALAATTVASAAAGVFGYRTGLNMGGVATSGEFIGAVLGVAGAAVPGALATSVFTAEKPLEQAKDLAVLSGFALTTIFAAAVGYRCGAVLDNGDSDTFRKIGATIGLITPALVVAGVQSYLNRRFKRDK